MKGKEYIQPEELLNSSPFGYSQVVTSQPGKLVFVAGQSAFGKDLKLIGGTDLKAQMEKALDNLHHALTAAGASRSDITMMRKYIVNYKPEHRNIIIALVSEFFGDQPHPASTVVGVDSLFIPGMLVEIEAIAVVPE